MSNSSGMTPEDSVDEILVWLVADVEAELDQPEDREKSERIISMIRRAFDEVSEVRG